MPSHPAAVTATIVWSRDHHLEDLLATLDTAVNTTPFLDQPQKSQIMSL